MEMVNIETHTVHIPIYIHTHSDTYIHKYTVFTCKSADTLDLSTKSTKGLPAAM